MTTVTEAIVFVGIMLAVLGLTYFAFTKRNFPLSFLAGLSWLLLLIYTRANPLPNMATGSTGDEIVLWLCILMMPMLWLNGYVKWDNDRKGKYRSYNESGDFVGRYETPPLENENREESPAQYRNRVHNRIMLAKGNRRRLR